MESRRLSLLEAKRNPAVFKVGFQASSEDISTQYVEASRKLLLKNSMAEPEGKEIFEVKTGNECMKEYATLPERKYLWKPFIWEKEVTCLFAKKKIGKTILAVQIAETVAGRKDWLMSEVEPSKVLYFDFELSLEQFGYRYSDKKDKTKHHIFQDNFIRVSMKKYVRAKPSDVIQAIREKVEEHNPKLIVIDNITKIGRKLEESEKAQELLEDLLAIKMEFDTAILILAHIRKRNDEEIITDDDLFGSSFQGNFFDSMFAVGQSICNPDLRYLKQIAVRTGETIYNTENVLVCRITKDNCFLRFTLDDSLNQTESEFTLLKKRTGKENDKLDRDIMEAYRQNPDKKFGEIARELKTNFNRVKRTLKRNGLTEND